MTGKQIKKEFEDSIYEVYSELGFKRKNRDFLILNRAHHQTQIRFNVFSNITTCEVSLFGGKIFYDLEKILKPFGEPILKSLKISIKDELRETLYLNSNQFNETHNISGFLRFYRESIDIVEMTNKACQIIDEVYLPFMNKMNDLEDLHAFINKTPETYQPEANYFFRDGLTLFRKMIIAKKVNKDYPEVCEEVKKMVDTWIAEPRNGHRFLGYLDAYFLLKEHLDNLDS